ncbi:MAG: LptA/OstA family protein [Beijerinckiaceae bacterium]
MMRAGMRVFLSVVAGACLMASNGMAQTASRTKTNTAGLGSFGGNDKQPINIEADKLDVFQKDGRAVYAGNVIAVRGETTMKCSQLIVFFDQTKANASGPQPVAASGSADNALKKLECKGPVSVVSKSDGKTQVVTGQNAVFNRVTNIVSVSGNVTLADGGNVTKCESFTYNTDSKIANCVAVAGGRVRGVFEPGSDDKPKPRAGQ